MKCPICLVELMGGLMQGDSQASEHPGPQNFGYLNVCPFRGLTFLDAHWNGIAPAVKSRGDALPQESGELAAIKSHLSDLRSILFEGPK